MDEHTAINCTGSGSPGCSWSANWLIGSGDLVDPGEQVEIIVSLINLTPVMAKDKEFTTQVQQRHRGNRKPEAPRRVKEDYKPTVDRG